MVDSPTKKCFPTIFNTKYIDEISDDKKITLRAALHNKDDVQVWMENYSSITRSDWIVKKGDPEMKRCVNN
jgi:hypothetical protein